MSDPVRHRRAPKYGRFMATGLLLAGVIAFALTLLTQGQSQTTRPNLFWVLMLYLGPLSLLAGAALAYWLDRRSLTAMGRQRLPEAEDTAGESGPKTPGVDRT